MCRSPRGSVTKFSSNWPKFFKYAEENRKIQEWIVSGIEIPTRIAVRKKMGWPCERSFGLL